MPMLDVTGTAKLLNLGCSIRYHAHLCSLSPPRFPGEFSRTAKMLSPKCITKRGSQEASPRVHIKTFTSFVGCWKVINGGKVCTARAERKRAQVAAPEATVHYRQISRAHICEWLSRRVLCTPQEGVYRSVFDKTLPQLRLLTGRNLCVIIERFIPVLHF